MIVWTAVSALALLVFSWWMLAAAEVPDPTLDYVEGSGAEIRYQSAGSEYYVLLKDEDLIGDYTPYAIELGSGTLDELVDPEALNADRRFYKLKAISVSEPEDHDGDGINDVYELLSGGVLNALNAADAALDPDGNGRTHLQEYQDAQAAAVMTTWTSSPVDGESGVAITRETIVRFSNPIRNLAALSADDFYATFGSQKLAARIHVSPNRKKATLFYDSLLPANARIQVHLDGDVLEDHLGNTLDGDRDTTPGGDAEFEFDTLTVTSLANTSVCGRVFASELEDAVEGGESVNCPLANVKITVDGKEDELFTFTDAFGNFRLEPVPVGRFFVHIDGSTTTSPVPAGGYYPFVGKTWESSAGREVNVDNVYLPLVVDGTLRNVSETDETMVEIPEEYVMERPELADIAVMVPANALFADDGTRGGMVGIAPVDPMRLPGQLPPGLNFSLVITVQTDGATNFDEPVAICFPNLPDPVTGEVLPPGAKTALWSFDHDIGRFLVVGTMTVTADGSKVCTDPGQGILAPGWHGFGGGSPGGGGDPPPNPPPPSCKPGPDPEPEPTPPGPPGPPGPPDPDPPAPPSNPDDPCKKPQPAPNGCEGEDCGGDPDGEEPDDGGGMGDPVMIATGEFVQEETDMHIHGRGFDFRWHRRYSSREGYLTAQGNHWDFNYNISIQPSGRLIKLRHGKANEDMLHQAPDGTFERREFFLNLAKQPDDTWTLSHGDKSQWRFHPCDDPSDPVCGKIERIVDRNGNTMRFEYNARGQLVRIFDTLDRQIDIAYNADGFITAVTDFTGRQVRYEYFGNGEDGGNFGDLKACISPAVTGTPHGNDSPDGKRRSYTYSKGFADPALNHNLLTITDGRRNDPGDPTFGDGPFVENIYSTVTDPLALNYDRCVRQVWGGDILTFHYLQVGNAAPGDGGAALHVIVNDRAGNVSEHFFDFGNRKVLERLFTGRADPVLATTDLQNRPTGKLRASDPDFYETRWEYNEHSLVTRIVHPNGNLTENTYQVDVNPNVDPQVRSNLRIRTRLPGSHTPVGDQEMLVEEWEYDEDLGCSNCGFNFVTKHTDARGHVTLSDYDDDGNLTQRTHRIASIVEDWTYNEWGQVTTYTLPDNGSSHRRVDRFIYHNSGPQNGYLASRIVDDGHLNLTTQWEVDPRGNVVRQIDPRGNDSLYTYNQLDQLVRSQSRPGPAGVRHEILTSFDANNNRIQRDVQNVDHEGIFVAANPWFTTTWDYEVLDHVIRRTQEVDPTHNIVTEYGYDKKRNLALIRYGEATNGNQPTNTITLVYDERDHFYQEIRAEGDPLQSTSQYDYDANGNQIAMRTGIEDGAHVTASSYDAYDRQVSETDPMGNVTTQEYDDNGNLAQRRIDGERNDVAGSANNVRLYQVNYDYDPMDRGTERRIAHFDASGVDIGDGESTTQVTWSDVSQALSLTDDNGNTTTRNYDTANRLLKRTDAKGNATTLGYDANSNLITVTELDKSDLATPDETFVTTIGYDALDRPHRVTDNMSNINEALHDSRGNIVRTSDAMRTIPAGPGNQITYGYDGLNRLIASAQFLTDDGTGAGTVTDTINYGQAWDNSSRLISQTDDNGNTTSYSYDPLNRRDLETFADTTPKALLFDAHNNRTQYTDQNGSVCLNTFDDLDRLIRKDITRAPGVVGVTLQTFGFDGLSRRISATDNNDPDTTSDDSLIVFAYDSLSHVILETQNGQEIESVYDGVGRRGSLTYPNGRKVDYTHDEIDRIKSIANEGEATSIAEYEYLGVERVLERRYANGAKLTYHDGLGNQTGYDALRRVTELRHVNGSGVLLSGFAYAFDKMHNRRYEHDLVDDTADAYQYDSAYRLTRAGYDTPEASFSGIVNNNTLNSDAEELGTDFQRWSLDGVGNWQEVEDADATTAISTNQMNEYTTFGTATVSHDDSGNLATNNNTTYFHDHLNRLVKIEEGGVLVANYYYDGIGRRTTKDLASGIDLTFYYDAIHCVEERDFANQTLRQYVNGAGVDNHLELAAGPSKYYYHSNSIGSVCALTDASETIKETYKYDAFGGHEIANQSGINLTTSALGNPFIFTGRRCDAESDLIYYRNRYYTASAGRFTERDPMRYIDGMGLYTYVNNNPVNLTDPLGKAIRFSPSTRMNIGGQNMRGSGSSSSGGSSSGGGSVNPTQIPKPAPKGSGGKGQGRTPGKGGPYRLIEYIGGGLCIIHEYDECGKWISSKAERCGEPLPGLI